MEPNTNDIMPRSRASNVGAGSGAPNGPIETPPHHATVSLKVLLLIFSVLLLIALGWFVYAQNTAVDTTDYSTATPSKTTATTEKTTEETATTTTTDETADWKTYTRTEETPEQKYLIKLPAIMRAYGADAGGATTVTVVDSGFTEEMHQEGKSMSDYQHLSLLFKVVSGSSLEEFVTSNDSGTTPTNKKVTTLDGAAAIYQEEGDTAAYYVDLTKTFSSGNDYLKISYSLKDTYISDILNAVKTLNFNPSSTELSGAVQIP